MASDKTKKILTNYLRKLTNLSARNKSIFLPRLSADRFLDIQTLSQLNGEKAFSIIESLISGKSKVICPVLDPRMKDANLESARLKKIQRADHFVFEESGSRELHVGWPFVRGKFSDGTFVHCPLLYFPVELKIKDGNWSIALRSQAEVTFNKSFLLAYAFYNKTKIPEQLLEETFEGSDVDSTVFRTQLYQLLQKANMAIHFNPDNYRDELTLFRTYKKDEFEEEHQSGELKLFPEAVLGLFPQAGSFLVPDYQQLLASETFVDLEDFFHARSPQKNDTSLGDAFHLVKEEKVYSILPMDSWQEHALKTSKLGHSLVVQGPPGTGKSQLICNLVSDTIAQGKKVLVVCQKRAALDVVYARLAEKRLADFVALVHDFKNDRKEIFEKLAHQIEKVDEYKSKNISLDAIQLGRQFFQLGKRIDQITEELESFRTALLSESDCGMSIKQLYLSCDPFQPSISLKQECNQYKVFEINHFIRQIGVYCFYAKKIEQKEYPWRERKSFSQLQASDRQLMADYLEEIPVYFSKVKSEFLKHFNTQFDWEQCEALIDKRLDAITIKELIAKEERYRYFQKMMPESEDETSSLWLANSERVIMACYEGVGIEKSVPAAQLGQLQVALHRSMKVRRSLIGLIRWELFSRDKYLVKRALVGNQLDSSKEGFKLLELRLDQRLNLEHNLSKLRTKDWLIDLPDGTSKTQMATWFADQQSAIKAKTIFKSIRGMGNLISPIGTEKKEFIGALETLFQVIAQLPGKKDEWLRYFLSSQISALTQTGTHHDKLRSVLLEDFDQLVEFDRLKESLTEEDRAILNKLFEKCQAWDQVAMIELFTNSIYLAWIDNLEAKHPLLRMASSGKIGLLEEELKELIVSKQSISNEILLLRSRERVTDELAFNRLNNRVTYRDLLHQVTKKKKIWPLRKVLTDFEDDVFRLMPCWLASPESVSAIFPMKETFDLVIFDEASQCFAERGIPALFRGKQAVVAGDSQQLKPGDFFQSRWEEDEEQVEPDTEVDSLLELCDRYLPNVQLQGHYRSKSLALIEFSNKHFYGGKLQMLPELAIANSGAPAIEYIKVDGVWENFCNEIEALKVVELIVELSAKDPGKNIGVITFNAPQQSLILDLLEASFARLGKEMPLTLFVKNIENVQGDERDIIIFSVGYAANKKGIASTQFGSLSQQGGENRLNVAVSRAREKVIVITSLWPEQLMVADTKNEGPKLLKAYLQFSREVSHGEFQPRVIAEENGRLHLKHKIRDWFANREYAVDCDQLPYCDLTMKKNNRLIGALLTDDNNYVESLSAKSIHALVPGVLESKRWPFLQLYSRNYWQDKDRFFNEIGKFALNNLNE